jgi:hypothetical protein
MGNAILPIIKYFAGLDSYDSVEVFYNDVCVKHYSITDLATLSQAD